MFGWLKSIWSRFRRDEREIFTYWDGAKQRAIDPYRVWRALWNSQSVSEFAEDIRRAANPMRHDGQPFYSQEEVCEAEDRLRALTRSVFGVAEWTEDTAGLTWGETNELLTRYLEYVEELKKKRKTSPMPSPPMESMEPAESSDIDSFPPGVDSDCSSSPIASSAAAPAGP